MAWIQSLLMLFLVQYSHLSADVIYNGTQVANNVDVEVERYELHKYTTLQYTRSGCTFENASPYYIVFSSININRRNFSKGDIPSLVAPFSSNPLSKSLCQYAQEYIDATMFIINDAGGVSEERIDIVNSQH
ncbi:hypothetical protein [Aeromonas sp. CA23]|uniref:fimbrial biogenesis chaperone n=1 Tax=Aeromonas sp. CA23 TaxID=2033032 RepID=UPI0012FD5522|nr:hypothetical protein [Aeromonas sp. CA23]